MKVYRSILTAGTVCLALCVGTTAWADYVGYSVSEDGRAPLPERVDDIEAKYLLNVEWGGYAGRKARLGVLEVDNTSSAGSFTVSGPYGDYASSGGSTVPVNGIEAIVIDSLNRTGRFRLVERTELNSVLGEQDLAASGRVAAPSGAKTGNVLGAQYLVQVVITDYESDVGGKSMGGIGGLVGRAGGILGGIKTKKGHGRVGLNVRLIDAETSEIVFTKQIESVIKESGLTFGGLGITGGGGLGGFVDEYSKTPVGQAVIAGVNEGVFELIKQIGEASAQGSVVKADANQIFVNLGADSVAVGDTLRVVEMGEALIDPDTGISLGGSETVVGEIVVAQVNEKYSIATPVSLSKVPARGDKVVATKTAEPMQFASSWTPPK